MSTSPSGMEEGRNDTDAFPPGFRFRPFDGELIVYYLQKKVDNEPLPYNKIQDVNIYMHNPQHLADQYQVLGDDIWYFFSSRERKYPNEKRPKRAAGEGYWKATGADKPVEHEGVVVGKKKSLVFYIGKPPNGDKTDWLMQEYTVDAPSRIKEDERDMRLDDWVLCKIYKKAHGKPKKGGQEEHHEQMVDAVTSPEEEVIQGTNYEDVHVEMNYDPFNMTSGYIQPPSPLPPLPESLDFTNYSNFTAYHPQQQVDNRIYEKEASAKGKKAIVQDEMVADEGEKGGVFCQAQHKHIPIPNSAANFSVGSTSSVKDNDIAGGKSKYGNYIESPQYPRFAQSMDDYILH